MKNQKDQESKRNKMIIIKAEEELEAKLGK